jgi:hypothetical protein
MLLNVNDSPLKFLVPAHHVQFLEIAVCNVMTTPVRHSIELQTMRELHIGFLEKPL